MSKLTFEQWVRYAAITIRNNNFEEFVKCVEFGSGRFGEEIIYEAFNNEIPLILDVKYISRMHKFIISSERYEEVVLRLLTTLTKLMASSGFTVGVDFSYGKEDNLSYLTMSETTALMVENRCHPCSWKHCLPYIKICS
jgi:type III secretion system FlhB-like substrate exporter